MKRVGLIPVVGLLSLGGILLSAELAAVDSEETIVGPETRVHGALHRIMHEADFSSAVTIEPEISTATTFGLGAVEGLMGEISIVGGRCWISSIRDERVETRVDDGRGTRAALLVTAEVGGWNNSTLAEETTLTALVGFVRNRAIDIGLDLERPLVFRVQGDLPGVDGHVIDGSRITADMSHEQRHDNAVTVVRYVPQPGVIFGFVSDAHQGVFTHKGQSVHAHAVLLVDGITSHVDAVTFPVGTVVELGIGAVSR